MLFLFAPFTLKKARMQGAQGTGREAYLLYVERYVTRRNIADGRFSA
jgi:hypothetical protein